MRAGDTDDELSSVGSGIKQRERLGCSFQPLDDVVFTDETTLRDPFAEFS